MRTLVVIAALLLGALPAEAKDFGMIANSHIITCSQAAKYRDTILLKEYDAIVKRYSDGTADRQRRVRDKLDTELKTLDATWAKTAAQLKKRVAAQWVAITLSIVGIATGEWAASRVSNEDRIAVKLLNDRAVTASSAVTSAAMTGRFSVADIALLPVSAIVAVTAPPALLGLTVLSLGLGAIDQYDNLADLTLEKSAYEGTAAVLKGALYTLAAKSVTNQLQRLNQVKAQIDRVCG